MTHASLTPDGSPPDSATQPAPEPPAVPTARPKPLSAAGTETAYGGVFYLVNLAIFLGFYPDFTRPLDPALPIHVLDLAELLGRRLLPEHDAGDKLWGLLARLAHREGEPAGTFRPPADWRVPGSWLAAFEAPYTWEVRDGRLRIAHAAGFVAVDVATGPDARARAAEELEMLGVHEAPVPGIVRTHPYTPTLAAWLDHLEGYVRARLALALPDLPPADLLAEPARVRVRDERVEIVFSLQDHPVAVRLAGLDRDPGWVPSAGLDFRFVYT